MSLKLSEIEKKKENPKRRKSNMLVPTIVMGALALIFLIIGYYKGEGVNAQGMRITFRILF